MEKFNIQRSPDTQDATAIPEKIDKEQVIKDYISTLSNYITWTLHKSGHYDESNKDSYYSQQSIDHRAFGPGEGKESSAYKELGEYLDKLDKTTELTNEEKKDVLLNAFFKDLESGHQYKNYVRVTDYDVIEDNFLKKFTKEDVENAIKELPDKSIALDQAVEDRKWQSADIAAEGKDSRTIWFTANPVDIRKKEIKSFLDKLQDYFKLDEKFVSEQYERMTKNY